MLGHLYIWIITHHISEEQSIAYKHKNIQYPSHNNEIEQADRREQKC